MKNRMNNMKIGLKIQESQNIKPIETVRDNSDGLDTSIELPMRAKTEWVDYQITKMRRYICWWRKETWHGPNLNN